MQAIIRASQGVNCIVRDQSVAQYYPTATVQPSYMDVFWHYETEPASAARLIGRFQVGAKITLPDNPAVDRNVIVRWITYAADGTPNVSAIEDSSFELIERQRVTEAPVITQVGASAETSIQIEVTEFDANLVQARQVQVATNNIFTTGLSDNLSTGNAAIATSIFISGNASDTRYVRVRHSSTGADGPWSAWSNVLMITFANPGGGGGTSGSGNGYGGDYYGY